MSLYTTTSGIGGLLPEQIHALIVRPVERDSVAFQVSTVLQTDSTSSIFPVVKEDPAAAWVAEGEEIAPDDSEHAEIEVVHRKVAGLTIVSRELAEDSNPSALDIVGSGLVRSIVGKVDQAFFAAATVNGPAGIGSTTHQFVDIGSGIVDLDPFAEAISLAEEKGALITSFVAAPATVLALSQLKELTTGSNKPLLGPDPSRPGARSVLGVPLLSSPFVTDGDVWAVPKQFVFTTLRSGTRLTISEDAYFSSDRVGVKATLRCGFGFPHPASIVRIGLPDES
ncbi:phage major capsid protein [Nocardia amamiensis]|uniref:Phage major capsid protein n=1 Tax=Nocardia amamiensis TaxID=404578 RepID=A0ABS0CN72_9NOCA|nr:phage major capsid protein [Nocardia amamiensis]MBF6298039.1 phage major capsid protein [Nocardia amamiensis]